jgi:hypothetical protein
LQLPEVRSGSRACGAARHPLLALLVTGAKGYPQKLWITLWKKFAGRALKATGTASALDRLFFEHFN